MKVLVATDGQPCSERALARVAALTPEERREVIVLTVFEPSLATVGGGQAPGRASAERAADLALAHACDILARQDIVPRALKRAGRPIEEIERVVADEDVDLVVVGTHHWDALTRAIAGSISRGLALHARTPVLIVP